MMEAEYRHALRRQAIHQAQRRRATPPAASPRPSATDSPAPAPATAPADSPAPAAAPAAAETSPPRPPVKRRKSLLGAVALEHATVVDLTQTTDDHSSVDALVLAEISKFESLTLDIGTQVRCVVRPQLCRAPSTASAPWTPCRLPRANCVCPVARASRSQGLKHKYYCGSVRFNVRMFWADHRRVLPLHYAVYLAEVGCKRAAAANVESVFSGAGKFTDEASSAGHVLLRRIVKLHYSWKYTFVRPTVEEVCARYKKKHAQGGGARQVAAPAPSGGGASD